MNGFMMSLSQALAKKICVGIDYTFDALEYVQTKKAVFAAHVSILIHALDHTDVRGVVRVLRNGLQTTKTK